MAKRKKKSKPARKVSAKLSKASRKAKPASRKRTPRADRAKILAEMKASGMTAKAAAKKYGISMWTIYNWRKRGRAGKPKSSAKHGRTTSRTGGALQADFRALIERIAREEITRLLGSFRRA